MLQRVLLAVLSNMQVQGLYRVISIFWWAYTRVGLTESLLCLEFFTKVIFISRERYGIRQKTMLLQQNAF